MVARKKASPIKAVSKKSAPKKPVAKKPESAARKKGYGKNNSPAAARARAITRDEEKRNPIAKTFGSRSIINTGSAERTTSIISSGLAGKENLQARNKLVNKAARMIKSGSGRSKVAETIRADIKKIKSKKK